jgi:hypothetical protein
MEPTVYEKGIRTGSGVFHYLFDPVVAGSFFFVITLSLYYPGPDNFWLVDDTQILKHAILFRPWQYFFSPVAWQRLSGVNFTPWLSFSYYIDYTFFGLKPYGFYVHQLLSLAVLQIAAYVTLRLWLRPVLSFFCALAFSLSPVFAELSQMLMCRHYIEGMVFSFLSIYAMVWGMRSGKARGAALISGIFYLLACLSKEIYVPLVFILLILPERTFRERVRSCFPVFAAALLYFFWRWYMLGRIGGGYGIVLSWPQDGKLFFPRLLNAMGVGLSGGMLLWWSFLAGFSSLTAASALFWADRKALLRTIMVLPLILLPIIPVSPGMSSRYVFLPLFCMILLHAVAWNGIIKKSGSLFVKAAVLIWAVFSISVLSIITLKHYQALKATIEHQGSEGLFLLREGTETDLLVKPVSLPHYYEGISWLRSRSLHLPAGPSVLFDAGMYCFEASKGLKFKRVWQYDAEQKKLIPKNAGDYICEICNKDLLDRVRGGVPLSVMMRCRGKAFSWEFGPHKEGSYAVLAGEPVGVEYLMPSIGKSFLEDMDIMLRVRYTSPDGWAAYSPLLNFKVAGGACKVDWQGDSIRIDKAGYCDGAK